MAVGLISVQLTHMLFSDEVFVAYNGVVFAIGLHTCLTYSSQVKIWEKRLLCVTDFYRAVLAGLAIVFVASFSRDSNFVFTVSTFLFLMAKFLERVRFNQNLINGNVFNAYKFAAILLLSELIAFSIFSQYFDEKYSRFLLPSFFVVFVAFVATREEFAVIERQPVRENISRSAVNYSVHSFFILIVLMLDRVIPTFFKMNGVYSDKNYLLVFTYSGACYAVGVAVLEVLRAKYFTTAAGSKTLGEYCCNTNWKLVSIAGLAYLVATMAAGFAINYLFALQGYAFPTNTLQIWIGLSAFFLSFLMLAYFQIYFLSRKLFRPLFVSWAVAFGVRLLGFLSGDWVVVSGVSFLSGVSGIGWLFYSQKQVKG